MLVGPDQREIAAVEVARIRIVHVHDVAGANVLALCIPDAQGAFNVASGTPHSVGEMAEALGRAFGLPAGSPGWPSITGGYRLGDVRHVFASTERIRNGLGFAPAASFEDGMREFAHAPLRASVARPAT